MRITINSPGTTRIGDLDQGEFFRFPNSAAAKVYVVVEAARTRHGSCNVRYVSLDTRTSYDAGAGGRVVPLKLTEATFETK